MDQKIEKTINSLYYGILYDKKTKKHRFLKNMLNVEEIHKTHENYKYQQSSTIDVNKFMNSKLPDNNEHIKCDKDYNKERMLQPYEILSAYQEILKAKNENEMYETLNSIIEYKLPSTIQSLNPICDEFLKKDKKTLNILIAGGGPIGLFIANYLYQIYNTFESNININVLILENRIVEEKIRKPFIRSRTFAINTRFLDVIFPGIYCKKGVGYETLMIPIKYLELLLYLKTYATGIPMYFTKKYEKWNDYEEFIKKYKIDMFFDATGGRLGNIKMKIDTTFMKEIDTKNDNYEFKINKNENLVTFDLKNKLDLWVSVENVGKKPFYDFVETYNLDNMDDFKYLENLCIPKHKIKNVLKNIKDDKLKKNLIYLYLSHIQNNPQINSMKFYTFKMFMYHRLKVAEWMHYKKYKFLYCGAGDTLFSSHFIRGAGLNRTILFSIKVCHLLPFLLNN
jgi:hypothetical protein